MASGSPKHQKSEQSLPHKGKSRIAAVILCETVFVFVLLLFSLILYQAEHIQLRAGGIQDITYRFAANYEDAVHNKENLIAISRFSDIQKDSSDSYMLIRFQIEPGERTRRLVVDTYGNQVSLRINNQEIRNTVNRSEMFTNSAGIRQTIEPSSQPVPVELIMKCMEAPLFRITAFPSGSIFSYVLLIIPVVYVASLLFCLLVVLTARKRGKSGDRYELPLLIHLGGLLCCFAAVHFLVPALVFLKIGLAVSQAAFSIWMFMAFKDAAIPQKSVQILISLGLILMGSTVICQHQGITLVLLKAYGVYFLICMLLWIFGKPSFSLYESAAGGCFFNTALILSTPFFLNRSIALWVMNLPLLLIILLFVSWGIFIRRRGKNGAAADSAVSREKLMAYKPSELGTTQDLVDIFLLNPDNEIHSRNVSLYVYTLCQHAGMSEEECITAAQAAFVHDIGKTMLPYPLVSGTGSLSSKEFEQMKKHTMFGYQLFEHGSSELMRACAVVAKEHHERADGNGYYGLPESQIHMYAQITAIADVFDAITTERSYKKAWSFGDGFDYIQANAGSLFSKRYVDIFTSSKKDIYRLYNMTRVGRE